MGSSFVLDSTGARGESPRLIVTGPSRSGTTVLAALLSRLGVNFGLKDQAWDVDSGYYEHPQLLCAYNEIRKCRKFAPLSDNLGHFFYRRAVRSLRRALALADAVKYPPLSSDLPALVRHAGYAPRLAISVRRFDGYALSRIRKEGVDWRTCKQDYMNTYGTALFNLCLYGGVIVVYEELQGGKRSRWLEPLMRLTGAVESAVLEAMQVCVGEARSVSWDSLADPDCDALYERLLSCR